MERGLEKLRKKKDVLSQLLKIQAELQERKVELLKVRAQHKRVTSEKTDEETSIDGETCVDEETRLLFNKIYPILRNVHREEVDSLELKHQIELKSAKKEKDAIRQCLKQVCERCDDGKNSGSSSKTLSSWTKELEKHSERSDARDFIVSSVNFIPSKCLPGTSRTTETLSFVFTCEGFCVWISMETAFNALPSDMKVVSEPHIPDLEAEVRDAYTHEKQIDDVITYILTYVQSEILPYV